VLEHLPVLIIIVPLIAGALCALARHETVCWWLTFAVTVFCFGVAVILLNLVQENGAISYALGAWAPPIGIEYRVDLLTAFLLILISVMAGIVHIYGRRTVLAEIDGGLRGWYYGMYLLCLCGLMGIVITGDAFNAFVFMEVSSLSMYVLIAMGRDKRALAASFQYLIMGTIGATMYVIGVGLLYAQTGTLNMIDLGERLAPVLTSPATVAGMAFIIVGLSLKLALFPLHLWLPNAYAYAPSATTAFLAATATKASVYLLARYLYTVFGFDFAILATPVPAIILLMSVAAMFAGSFIAMFQDNVKRMLAYSSVAQMGYITLGFSLASLDGLTGSLVHIFNHAMMKGALFMLVGGIALQLGSVRLKDMAGIGRDMPITMAGFVIAGASMLGVPGTVGFVSKWYLALGALENGAWWVVALLVMSSLLVLVYMGRVIEIAYFRPRPADAASVQDPPRIMLLMAWLLISGCIYFGIDTDFTLGTARDAASALMGPAS
jgi:multicomponent Na+:H+ antiporter subunit D